MRSTRGYSTLEILAAVAVVAIFGAVAARDFSMDRARAIAFVTRGSDIAKALLDFKSDAGCYPMNLAALYDRDQAQATRCGVDGRRTWRAPNLSAAPLTPAGGISMADLVPGAEASLVSRSSGAGRMWLLRFTGVPRAMLLRIAEACRGPGNHAGRCAVDPAVEADTGSFDLLFDETM